MSGWPFERLPQLGCIVKFGYLSPNEIADQRPVDGRAAMHRDQRNKLLESITAEGVRNPLVCSAYEGKETYVSVGHHRLWASKKAKAKQIPVIVNDFCNRYPDFEVLNSIDEVRSKFKDQPNIIKSFRSGLSTSEPLVNNDTWWKK